MSNLARATRNFARITGARILARAAGIVVTALLARRLGDDVFGTWTLCMSFASLFSILARLGIRNILVRELVQDSSSSARLIGSATTAIVVLGAISIGVVSIAATARGYPAEVQAGIGVFAISFALIAVENLLFGVFEAKDAFGFQAWMVLVRQVAWTGLVLVGLAVGWPWLSFAWALVAVSLLIVALSFVRVVHLLRPLWPRFDWRVLKGLVISGLPLAGSAMLVELYLRIDVLMLDAMTSSAVVGHYGVSLRFVQALAFLAAALPTALLPLFAQLVKESPEEVAPLFTQASRSVAQVLVLIATIVSATAAFSIPAVFGAEYMPGAAVLSIAIWSVALQPQAAMLGRVLVSLKLQKQILYGSAISVVINVVGNAVFIGRFGASGAAATSVGTMLFVVLWNGASVRRALPGTTVPFVVWRLLLIGSVCSVLASVLYDRFAWGLSPILGLTLTTFILTAILTRSVNKNDLYRLARVARPN